MLKLIKMNIKPIKKRNKTMWSEQKYLSLHRFSALLFALIVLEQHLK